MTGSGSRTRLRTTPGPAMHGERVVPLIAIVAAVVMLFVSAAVFNDPPVVETFSIDNPTEYDIHVSVGETGSPSRVLLGVAIQNCVTTFHSVIDQGAMWVVQLEAQGRHGGEPSVARDALEETGWTYRIDTAVAGALRSQGAPVPPEHTCPRT